MAEHHEQSHKKCSWTKTSRKNLGPLKPCPCHGCPRLSAPQVSLMRAHFVHIFGHSCNIFRDRKSSRMDHFPWQSQGVLRLRFFWKRPYVIVSPRITLIQGLLKYSPLPDIPPFQIMVWYWIIGSIHFWGPFYFGGIARLGLLGGRNLRSFKALTVMSPWPFFFGFKHLIARSQTSNGG